jgi:hypothetical protein
MEGEADGRCTPTCTAEPDRHIRQGKKWREVGVDAKTGRILENSAESANPKD